MIFSFDAAVRQITIFSVLSDRFMFQQHKQEQPCTVRKNKHMQLQPLKRKNTAHHFMTSDYHQSVYIFTLCSKTWNGWNFLWLYFHSLLFISAAKRPAEEDKEKVVWQVA